MAPGTSAATRSTRDWHRASSARGRSRAGRPSPSPTPGTPPTCRTPKTGHGVSWVVRFESVNYRARVYLNGRQIGSHEGAYLPFEVPADKLRTHGVNHLVVRVDSRRSETDLPPLIDQD